MDDLHLALQSEIESAKEAKPLKLHNLKRQDNGVYVCTTPLKLEGEGVLKYGGNETTVSMQTSNGITAISGIEASEIGFFKDALISQDQTTLLQKVADEFSAYKPNEIALKLFHQKVSEFVPVEIEDENLNHAQCQIVGRAIAGDNLLVVGPAGTGKTKTIVSLMNELLKRGKRVLVVSHANLAVEGVFASFIEGKELKEAELVLSIITELPELKKYSPKSLAKERGESIKDEMDVLEGATKAMAERKRELHTIIEPADMFIDATDALVNDIERQIRINKGELKALKDEKASAESRLARLEDNGFLATIKAFISTDRRDELQALIENMTKKINAKNNEIDALSLKHDTCRTSSTNKAQEVENAKVELREIETNLKKIKDRVAHLREEMTNAIGQDFYKGAKVAGTTLMSAATNRKVKDAGFDVIIVDEGSMANLPMLLLAINCAKEKVIVFGDPVQLPPVARAKGLKLSIYDVLGITEALHEGKLHPKALMLDTQYRCHPDIAELTSELFYGGMLKNGRTVSTGKKAMYIKNTHGQGGRFRAENGSYTNERHQRVVIDQVRSALRKGQRSIGVISPFKAQATAIQNLFNLELKDEYPDASFKSATIHSFQGQEKDVVIFDFTFGQGYKDYGLPQMLLGDTFSDAAKLLNVATTRARDFFVLVVDQQYTHKMASQLPNYDDQIVVKWLNGVERVAYKK